MLSDKVAERPDLVDYQVAHAVCRVFTFEGEVEWLELARVARHMRD